jgi:quinol monooxygenase YgiN
VSNTQPHQASVMSTPSTGRTNVAFAVAKPGMSEALGTQLLELVTPSRAEPGCQRYEVHQSVHNQDSWMIIESWLQEADFDHHMQTPYVRDFLALAPTLCVQDIEIGEYHEVSPSAVDHAGGIR